MYTLSFHCIIYSVCILCITKSRDALDSGRFPVSSNLKVIIIHNNNGSRSSKILVLNSNIIWSKISRTSSYYNKHDQHITLITHIKFISLIQFKIFSCVYTWSCLVITFIRCITSFYIFSELPAEQVAAVDDGGGGGVYVFCTVIKVKSRTRTRLQNEQAVFRCTWLDLNIC